MKRNRQISLKECYAILGLEKGATQDDLKRAYRRRAFELHPDLNPGNPAAGRQFQQLNEAYVVLAHVLAPAPDAEAKQSADQAPPGKDKKSKAHHAKAPESEPQPEPEPAQATQAEKGPSSAEDAADRRAFAEEQRRAAQAYAQEDVLRDLLNDPFARRVFEDIYSEIHKQDAATPQPPPSTPPPPPNNTPQAPVKATPEPKPRKIHMEWGKHSLNLDFSKGVKGAVKGWLRHQIDEEQTFKLPASSLVPGARIRLQIRRGLSDEINSVEITLPKDFVVGKPVRLRGLGKRIGPWQGDLYLTLEPK